MTGRHPQACLPAPSERESGCSLRRCSKACSRIAASFFCSATSRRSVCAGLRSGSLRTWRTPDFVRRSSKRTTTEPGSGGSATGSANVCESEDASQTARGIEVDTAAQNGDGPGRFTVYPRGEQPHEPAFAFAGDAYQSFLGELAATHDVVLIIGPATERQAEVRALADNADSVLLLLPAWIPHSRAAALTTLRSIRSDANLVVGIFGDAEDVPLAAGNR